MRSDRPGNELFRNRARVVAPVVLGVLCTALGALAWTLPSRAVDPATIPDPAVRQVAVRKAEQARGLEQVARYLLPVVAAAGFAVAWRNCYAVRVEPDGLELSFLGRHSRVGWHELAEVEFSRPGEVIGHQSVRIPQLRLHVEGRRPVELRFGPSTLPLRDAILEAATRAGFTDIRSRRSER